MNKIEPIEPRNDHTNAQYDWKLADKLNQVIDWINSQDSMGASESKVISEHYTGNSFSTSAPEGSNTDTVTSCHNVKPKIYSGGEGTSHYFCPVCDEAVNADGTNPSTPKGTKDSIDEQIKRYAKFINGLSPHNLHRGEEALTELFNSMVLKELEWVLDAVYWPIEGDRQTILERIAHYRNQIGGDNE